MFEVSYRTWGNQVAKGFLWYKCRLCNMCLFFLFSGSWDVSVTVVNRLQEAKILCIGKSVCFAAEWKNFIAEGWKISFMKNAAPCLGYWLGTRV